MEFVIDGKDEFERAECIEGYLGRLERTARANAAEAVEAARRLSDLAKDIERLSVQVNLYVGQVAYR